MTDRYNTLTVVLERDIRDDDAEKLLNAIHQLRGVLSVKGNASDLNSLMAEERAKRELGQKIWKVIYPEH